MTKINFPTEKEFAEKIAKKALDEFLYEGKTIREWIKIIVKQEPKTEWEQDHAILQAYSDGANEVLDKIRAEISEYGSLWVEYKIEGHSDRDIEKIVETVLKQAKQQVLQTIDKYRQEG